MCPNPYQTMSCTFDKRNPNNFDYTNWRLKIFIWRLYFSSQSPNGDLKIFLILSPVSPASLPTIPKQVNLLAGQHRAKNYDHSIRTMFIFEIHVQYVYCLHLSTENMKSTHEIALGHLKCHFMFEPCLYNVHVVQVGNTMYYKYYNIARTSPV